jgi:hypothetical protein
MHRALLVIPALMVGFASLNSGYSASEAAPPSRMARWSVRSLGAPFESHLVTANC